MTVNVVPRIDLMAGKAEQTRSVRSVIMVNLMVSAEVLVKSAWNVASAGPMAIVRRTSRVNAVEVTMQGTVEKTLLPEKTVMVSLGDSASRVMASNLCVEASEIKNNSLG